MRIRGVLRLDNRRQAMIAVQVALTLTALLSVAALALDVGILLAEQRHAQAVADAAALAGAIDLYTNYPYNNGYDTSGTAAASALATADTNGYSNDGTTSIVTVNIPPQSGYFVGVAGYVEVIAQYNQPRGFSNLFGSGPIPVKARAVARGAYVVPKGGVLALDPTAAGAFTDGGQGIMTVNGGGTVIIDSNNTGTTGAMTVNGGGSVFSAANNVTGTATTSSTSTITGTINTSMPPTPDPYAYIPPPPMPAAGNFTKTVLPSGTGFQYDVYPGTFGGSGKSLPVFTSSDIVYFHQDSSGNGALYYLASGGLTSTGANLLMGSVGFGTGAASDPTQGGGIMFYNAGTRTNDSINIAGSSAGTVDLYGINTTNTSSSMYIYNGILIFQARNAPEAIQITGNGNFSMEGAFYAPDATLKLTGQGGSSVIGSNLIADQITITGQGNITVDYNGFVQPKGRFLGLVE